MKITRPLVQLSFLTFTIVAVYVVGGNAERWCPFGGIEALYTYFGQGTMTCSLGVSNFYIMAAVLAMTLLARRAFCGYMCPIGTISEWLQRGAAAVGIRPWRPSPGVDRALSLLKYPLLVFILYITYTTSELLFRAADPCYALISRHGKDITYWAYVVSGVIVLGSLLVVVPFCRWFCPLAAVLNPFSRFGAARVKRHEGACIDCGKCAKACPMAIPVDKVIDVKAARCTSCLDCVDVCPVREQGAITYGLGGGDKRGWSRAAVVMILLVCTGSAVVADQLWQPPSYVREFGQRPAKVAVAEFRIDGVTCRGSSNGLVTFLTRKDGMSLGDYIKVETWPAPEKTRVRITYDPAVCDDEQIKCAITQPYYNPDEDEWGVGDFEIEGYDPLDAECL